MAPLKVKLNGEVLKAVFKSRDQEIFKTWNSTYPLRVETAEDSPYQDFMMVYKPNTGRYPDFDFDWHFNKDDVGCSSDNLAFRGIAKYKGDEIRFKGPIDNLKWSYE